VALQVDELCNCRTLNTLRNALNSLPKTLDETYCRILGKVNEHDRLLVHHILQCVCFYLRPILVEEVGHIYRIGDRRKPPFDSEDALFHPKDAVDLCGGLLCLVSVDVWKASRYMHMYMAPMTVVQLAHFSVKEYLLSPRAMSWRLDEELSHVHIIKAGIAYYLEFMVSRDVTAPDANGEIRRNHPAAVYCASYISDHLSHLNPRDHPHLTESFQYLLGPSSLSTLDHTIGLWNFYRRVHPSFTRLIPERNPLEVITLRIAARLGLPLTCQWLLSINTLAQISSAATDPGIESLFLIEAVIDPHVDVLKVLLTAGADINTSWRSHASPALHIAVWLRYREIVEILINKGADVNTQYDGQTPMDVAIERKHEEIVNILRDAGGRPFGRSEARQISLGMDVSWYDDFGKGSLDWLWQRMW
jgi:ankyrin repeat domain-containing protein 50